MHWWLFLLCYCLFFLCWRSLCAVVQLLISSSFVIGKFLFSCWLIFFYWCLIPFIVSWLHFFCYSIPLCCSPILRVCKDETHTPEMETWESSKSPKTLEFDCRGQNTLHWSVLYIIGKISKCRCRKWAHMSHLNIFITSYGKKKGQESNCQFDSRPLKVGNRPDPDACKGIQGDCNTPLESSWWELQLCFKPRPNWRYEQKIIVSQNYKSLNYGNFKTFPWESRNKKAIRMWVPWGGTKNIIWGKVVASFESRAWWILWVQSCLWLVLALKVF